MEMSEKIIKRLLNRGLNIISEKEQLERGLARANASINFLMEENSKLKHEIPKAQKWIQVSERLPDDLEEVIVTWVNHNPAPYYDFTKDKPSTGAAVFYKKQWFWSSPTCVDYLAECGMCDADKIDNDIEITAWMPLPKPYQGGVSG